MVTGSRGGGGVEELKQAACAWAEEARRMGAREAEIYVQDSGGVTIKVFGGEVEELRSSASRGVGVRVLDGGRLGYAYCSGLEPEEVRRTIRDAINNARYSTPDEHNRLPEGAAEGLVSPEGLGMYQPETEEMPVEGKVELALRLEELARGQDPRIRAVESAAYSDSVYRVALANTGGFCGAYRGCDCHCYVAPIAGEGEGSQSGFSFAVGKRPSDLDLEGCAREAAGHALMLLGAESMPSRRTAVILDNLIAAEFLGVLAGALSAEAVLKGRSLLAGRLGESIGSDKLTLVDDALMPSGMATAPFDDEGVPSRRQEIVKDGVLRGYLHTVYTASRSGTASTGNARRGSYRERPRVSPSNFYLDPGERSREEILREVGEGVLVLQLVGVHAGANPISGEISVGALGMLLQGGEPHRPLREITIAGNLLELLKSLSMKGDDLRFLPLGGSLGCPTIVFDGVMVAGRS
jgi:PmbA protein